MAQQDAFVTILAFGIGEHGQLGTSSKTTQGTPTQIDHSNASFISSSISGTQNQNEKSTSITIPELICDLSAGGSHGAFITTYGSIYTWGGGPKLNGIPRQVVLLRGKTITHIACGALHVVAIEGASRHVYQWGIVGNAITEDESTFTTPQFLHSFENPVQKLVCGARHSLVISDKNLCAFGSNKEGQLGLGDTTDQPTPQLITIDSNYAVTDIAAGGEHSLCVSDGKVYSWGSSKYGQLGHGNTEPKLVPTLVSSESMKEAEIVSVSAGDYQSYAIAKDGTLFSWGRGNCGQLGHGNTENTSTPKAVEFFKNAKEKVVEVKSGGGFQLAHAIARCESSAIYAWGSNKYHQLGVLKNQENELVPTIVVLPQGTTVHQISCGWLHTLLLVSLPSKPQTPKQQQHALGSFVKLPNEIILEVLKFLADPKSFARLAQTSSGFRDLLRNELLWEVAYVQSYGTLQEARDISWRNRCKRKFVEAFQNKHGFGNDLVLSSNNNNTTEGFFQKIGKKIWNKKIHNAVLVGLDAGGKTTLIYYYFKKEPVVTIPTIGMYIESFTYGNTSFVCWDLSHNQLRPLYRHFLKDVSALLFMVDSNDRDRFEEVHDHFWKMIEMGRMPENNVKIVLVFANKQDLPFAATCTELAKVMELEKLEDMKWFIQPSAMNNLNAMEGIKEGFAWLSQALDQL